MISAAEILRQQLLVVAEEGAEPGRGQAEDDEDRREAGDEEQARDQHPPPAGVVELGRRDAADRREVAGDERQHAGREEGDDARPRRRRGPSPRRRGPKLISARNTPRRMAHMDRRRSVARSLRASPLLGDRAGAAGPGSAPRLPGRDPGRRRPLPRVRPRHADQGRRSGPVRCSPASSPSTRPARVRAAWQAAVAPLVGLTAALGVLTGSSPALAIPAMALVGAAAGYCFSVSPRLSIAGLSVALSLVIAQGLPLDAADALPALLLATAGGLLQPLFSMLVWAAGDRAEEGGAKGWSTERRARRAARPTGPCARSTPATRCASARRSRSASPPTGSSAWRTTGSGSR